MTARQAAAAVMMPGERCPVPAARGLRNPQLPVELRAQGDPADHAAAADMHNRATGRRSQRLQPVFRTCHTAAVLGVKSATAMLLSEKCTHHVTKNTLLPPPCLLCCHVLLTQSCAGRPASTTLAQCSRSQAASYTAHTAAVVPCCCGSDDGHSPSGLRIQVV